MLLFKLIKNWNAEAKNEWHLYILSNVKENNNNNTTTTNNNNNNNNNNNIKSLIKRIKKITPKIDKELKYWS